MTSPPGAGGVGGSKGITCPGIVGGEIQPFCMDYDVGNFRAHGLCCRQGTFGKACAKVALLAHLFNEGKKGVRVAPGIGHTVGIFRGDPALFPALHAKPHHGSHGDGVHPHTVGQVVAFGHYFGVVDKQICSHHAKRFVFRSHALYCIFCWFCHLNLTVASYRTVFAGVRFCLEFFCRIRRTKFFGAFGPCIAFPVFNRHVSQGFHRLANGWSAMITKSVFLYCCCNFFTVFPGKGIDLLRIVERNGFCTAHSDGFQVFGTHDASQSATPHKTVLINHDAGNSNQVLACRANAGNA